MRLYLLCAGWPESGGGSPNRTTKRPLTVTRSVFGVKVGVDVVDVVVGVVVDVDVEFGLEVDAESESGMVGGGRVCLVEEK